jgi:hypothetical protein
LLAAQFALRHELFRPAEAAALRHRQAFPDDELARRTLRKSRQGAGRTSG